jgi:Sec-independent protein translocase protein TatA
MKTLGDGVKQFKDGASGLAAPEKSSSDKPKDSD